MTRSSTAPATARGRRLLVLPALALAVMGCTTPTPAAGRSPVASPSTVPSRLPAAGATPTTQTPAGRADSLDPAGWPLRVSDAACPRGPTELADPVDLVLVAGRAYTAVDVAPAARVRLGRTVLTTRCRWADGAPEDGYRERDGDASSLPRGTAVREVLGSDPRFRLGATADGRVYLFEAPPPADDGTGADVLPGVGPHVRAVHLASRQDGRTVLARIADPDRVARLVRALQQAPYRTSVHGGPDVFLLLRLDDGTTVRRAYASTTGSLAPGLRLPAPARDELARALAAGEGQPRPRCVRVPGDASGLGIDPEAEHLVGLPERQVRERAAADGVRVRVVGRDGRCSAPGPRLLRGRVDVDVRDGVVRDAAAY